MDNNGLLSVSSMIYKTSVSSVMFAALLRVVTSHFLEKTSVNSVKQSSWIKSTSVGKQEEPLAGHLTGVERRERVC